MNVPSEDLVGNNFEESDGTRTAVWTVPEANVQDVSDFLGHA